MKKKKFSEVRTGGMLKVVDQADAHKIIVVVKDVLHTLPWENGKVFLRGKKAPGTNGKPKGLISEKIARTLCCRECFLGFCHVGNWTLPQSWSTVTKCSSCQKSIALTHLCSAVSTGMRNVRVWGH